MQVYSQLQKKQIQPGEILVDDDRGDLWIFEGVEGPKTLRVRPVAGPRSGRSETRMSGFFAATIQ